MADYFIAIVPGRPIIQTFQQIEATRVVCSIPLVNNEQLHQFGISLLKPLPEGQGVGVHLCVQKEDSTEFSWQYLGALTNGRVSDFFRIGSVLEDIDPETLGSYQLHIGLNMEALEPLLEQVPAVATFDNQKVLHSARGIAKDLHTYIASFDTVPNNVIDRWYTRFVDRHRREPYFWLETDKV